MKEDVKVWFVAQQLFILKWDQRQFMNESPGVVSIEAIQCDLEWPCKIYNPMRSRVITGAVLPSSGKELELET